MVVGSLPRVDLELFRPFESRRNFVDLLNQATTQLRRDEDLRNISPLAMQKIIDSRWIIGWVDRSGQLELAVIGTN